MLACWLGWWFTVAEERWLMGGAAGTVAGLDREATDLWREAEDRGGR